MGETLGRIIKHPALLFLTFGHRGLFNWMDDATYLKIAFKIKMGEALDLEHPVTFNQKLQWLKLNDRNPEYSKLVDKYEVKKIVSEKIGSEYVIPTLGVWDKFDDIEFDSLPNQFVLKCTHDSGGLIIVRDKPKLDIKAARKKINKSLKHNYFWGQREWVYKNVEPRIIAEKYMEEKGNANKMSETLVVYKIFNFLGKPELIQVIQDDNTDHETIDYFDTSWTLQDLRQNFPNSLTHLEKPDQLERMLELAKKLSKGHRFIRTDFYVINGEVFFSEFTFYSDSGFAYFEPQDWDERLGKLIKLPSDAGGGVLVEIDNAYVWVHSSLWSRENMPEKQFDEQLVDYKFLCFNGRVKSIFTCTERNSKDGLKVTFFDREWNKMPFERHYPTSGVEVMRPRSLDKMIEISEKLAGDIPFVRIDLYDVKGQIYFGEYTFFPGSGMEEFTPREWDKKMGDLIDLSLCDRQND